MKLNETYQRDEFINFLETFLPDFEKNYKKVNIQNSNLLKDGNYLGKSKKVDIEIFEFTHEDDNDSRASLILDVFRILKNSASFKALVVFKNENMENWKLSLMTVSYEINEKGKVETILSNPKRFSFSLGPDSKIKTPEKYLIDLGQVEDFSQLKERFSVEVVNKDFYLKISNLYMKLVGGEVGKEKFSRDLKLPTRKNDEIEIHDFAVRLIGRIIFCWFLREKKSINNIPLLNKETLSLEAIKKTSDYYVSVLEPLFFEILNKPIDSRKEEYISEKYKNIPYLNGGLFTPIKEDYYLNKKDSKVEIPNSWFHELFEVLETYNFTIDENTNLDIDLSIDPEMLGRVFENLLAEINPETGNSARKNTGSYYTPREVVDYMVDESLLNFLISKTLIDENKIRSLITYNLDDDLLYPLNEEEKEKIVASLINIKIFDPACGSGAFPMGVLQKIIHMFNVIDEDGSIWLNSTIANLSNELQKLIEKEFKNKNLDYIRKLSIIRESIFGSDIQPIATEISRLRCLLTLIVEEKVDDNAPNRGIEPLPNLDFKFVTANTLLSLKNVEKNNQIELFDDTDAINDLKSLRDRYFTANGSEKDTLKLDFVQLQKSMLEGMLSKGFQGHGELTTQLSTWEPFTNRKTNWFDPEWMFGIVDGFDIVLANPPYVDSEEMVKRDKEERELIKEEYSSTTGNWDLYIPFIELAIKNLKKDGFASYITPNKWLSIKYGKGIRGILNNKIVSIGNLNNIKVFDAGNSPLVFLFSNNIQENLFIDIFKMGYAISERINISSELLAENWGVALASNIELVQKIQNKKSNFMSRYTTYNPASVSESYEIKKILEDLNDKKEYQLEDYYKLVTTGTIGKSENLWGIKETTYSKNKYLLPAVNKEVYKDNYPRRVDFMNRKKIISKGMRFFDCFIDLDGSYLAAKSTLIIHSEKDSLEELKVALALFNSKVINFFIKEAYGALGIDGGINITGDVVESLPIPELTNKIKNELINLVDQLLEGKNRQENIDKINHIVYGLYDLTEEDQRIVEERTQRKR